MKVSRQTVQAVVVGLVLVALGIALRKFADAEGPQILLLLPTFLAVGFIARDALRGIRAALVVLAVLAVVNTAVFEPGTFSEMASNPSVGLATVIMLFVIPAVPAAGLAAAAGFIGSRLGKRASKEAAQPTPPAGA